MFFRGKPLRGLLNLWQRSLGRILVEFRQQSIEVAAQRACVDAKVDSHRSVPGRSLCLLYLVQDLPGLRVALLLIQITGILGLPLRQRPGAAVGIVTRRGLL